MGGDLTPKNEINIRFLVKEKQFRTQMTNLFQVLEAHENAKTLSKLEFHTNISAYGNPLIRKCFSRFVNWINDLQEMSNDNEVFSQQILEPIKISSDYVLKIATKTTKIIGWVFAKSRKYKDSYTGEHKQTISMIVPELQTIMSMRCSQEEAEKISYGMHEFSYVKPIPLTNRLLQFKPRSEKLKDTTTFGKWNFLNASIEDLEHFKCSIEMEHYCEVSSKDSEKRHLLGAPLTVTGKVVAVNWPYVSIESCITPNFEIEFAVSEHLDNAIKPLRIDDFQGKNVKILCVQWYDSGLESKSHPKHPEVFFIDELENQVDVIEHELIGFVRVRKKVDLTELSKKFSNIDISKIDSLYVEDKLASIQNPRESKNDIIMEYCTVTEKIASLRNINKKSEHLFFIPEDVLDKEKVSIKYLSKKDDDVAILLKITHSTDFKGIKEFTHLPLDDKNKRNSKKQWFLNTGLITKSGKNHILTKKGIQTTYQSQKKYAKLLIQSLGNEIISISKLEEKIPPSILLSYLKENNYKKFTAYGTITDLFWYEPETNPSTAHKKFVEDEISKLCKPALEKMSNVRHQFHHDVILETLMQRRPEIKFDQIKPNKLSYFCAQKIIDFLKTQGTIIERDNFLELPLSHRIYILLKSNPEKIFSLQDISEKIIFPRTETSNQPGGKTQNMKNELLTQELNSLLKHKRIIQFKNGYWQSYLDPEQFKNKINKFLKSKLRKLIIKILQGKSMDQQRFNGLVGYQTRKICEDVSPRMDYRSLQKETVEEMIKRNEIIFTDDMVKLSDSKNGKPMSGELLV